MAATRLIRPEPVETAFRKLEALDLASIESTGDWQLGRMFCHLEQGVLYSMTGYPDQKSKMFQATAGKLAFTVFSLRGRMSHALDEPIPGEKVADVSAEAGLDRLWKALEKFGEHKGQLKPHFAYGALTRDQFALAHLMHLENHLEEVRPV